MHLFFFLSGFGLGLSSSKMEAFTFYKKRFHKILIPYYVTIFTIYFLSIIHPIYNNNSLYALGGHLFLYKMFDEKIMGSFGYHFWFISTIVQFYIAFPLIIKLKNKTTSNKFIIISTIISLIYCIAITSFNLSHLRIYNNFFLQYLWEFNIGILLAGIYINNGKKIWDQSSGILAIIAISGIGIMVFMAIKGGRLGRTFNDIPASIGYFSLTAFAYSICSKTPKLINSISYIGRLSYELYLTHMLVFILLNELLIKSIFLNSNIFISLFFIFPSSIILAKLFMLVMKTFYQKTEKIFK